MTCPPALDPEVLADLRRREASERDPSRDRARGWVPPQFVEHWPCLGCGTMVGMTRDAVDLHEIFNRELERRRDRPLQKRGQCDECKAKDTELARQDSAEKARQP